MKLIHAIHVALSVISLWLAVVKDSLTTPVAAPKPLPTARCVRVDRIVIARHRQVRKSERLDLRYNVVHKREFTETWWVSFWNYHAINVPGLFAVLSVDRGWWPAGDILMVAPCTEGFAVERKGKPGRPGLTVIGTELWIIDAPFDWEVRTRSRSIYKPLGD